MQHDAGSRRTVKRVSVSQVVAKIPP